MTRSMTFCSWALLVPTVLGLGACNRDWDARRATPVVAEAAADAVAQDMGAPEVAVPRGGGTGTRNVFADLPDRGDLVGYPQERAVRREGAYSWHRVDVSEEHALRAIFQGDLRFTAPDGTLLTFEYERHVEHPTGDWTWVGRLRDAPTGRQAILTFGADAVFGSIAQSASEPLRLAMRDGVSWLVETDSALLAGVEERVLQPEVPDFLVPPLYFGGPAAPKASGDGHMVSASSGSLGTSSAASSPAPTVVDVLVGYTPGFAAYHGGDSQARTRVNFLVEVANQGYVNSQIDARVRLVHAMPVNYPDATANADTLEKLSGYKSGTGKTTPDPVFTALREARETYGADLVTLVRKFNTPENDGCGIAWLIGGGQTAISQSYEYFGYSVVSDGVDQGDDGKNYFCRDETMIHELAHNMGSAHDIETAKGDDGVLQADEYGRYPYSFGYRTGPGTGDFYTIMAYRVQRDSGPQQQAYRVFSNPNITFCGNNPCGTSTADNARSLRQTLPLIAGFRQTVVFDKKNGGDVNGDGMADVIWHNPGQSRLAYWWMSGASIIGSAVMPAPSGFKLLGIADFDGNNRAELLWSGNGAIYMSIFNGSGFTGVLIGSHDSGWIPLPTDDIDGDGRADIMWHHPAQNLLAYWFMNGTAIKKSAVLSAPAGFKLLGAADFNGDGRAELLWSGNGGIYTSAFNGSGFNGALVGTHDSGWIPLPTDDIDGDGLADIIWHNPAQSRLAYWFMNGSAIKKSAVLSAPAGFTLIGSADFKGDGRAELLWSGNGGMYTSTFNGSGFAGSIIGSHDNGWIPVIKSIVR